MQSVDVFVVVQASNMDIGMAVVMVTVVVDEGVKFDGDVRLCRVHAVVFVVSMVVHIVALCKVIVAREGAAGRRQRWGRRREGCMYMDMFTLVMILMVKGRR